MTRFWLFFALHDFFNLLHASDFGLTGDDTESDSEDPKGGIDIMLFAMLISAGCIVVSIWCFFCRPCVKNVQSIGDVNQQIILPNVTDRRPDLEASYQSTLNNNQYQILNPRTAESTSKANPLISPQRVTFAINEELNDPRQRGLPEPLIPLRDMRPQIVHCKTCCTLSPARPESTASPYKEVTVAQNGHLRCMTEVNGVNLRQVRDNSPIKPLRNYMNEIPKFGNTNVNSTDTNCHHVAKLERGRILSA